MSEGFDKSRDVEGIFLSVVGFVAALGGGGWLYSLRILKHVRWLGAALAASVDSKLSIWHRWHRNPFSVRGSR